MSIDAVLSSVSRFQCDLVEVTGGEPLAQKNTVPLLQRLVEAGYEVLLETSGAYSVRDVPARVRKIVDIKTPDSGMAHHNDDANFAYLTQGDEIKFVIQSRADYEWARELLRERPWDAAIPVLFSPAWESEVRVATFPPS